MSTKDYVICETILEEVGLLDLWRDAQEGKRNTRPLIDELVKRAPSRFPEGFKLVLCAEIPSSPTGLIVRIEHPRFKKLWGPIPISAEELR